MRLMSGDPLIFFSLLTKRTQRKVLGCEFSAKGNPRPCPFVPTAVALCTCGDVCCIVAIAGVCSGTVCVSVEWRRHSKQQLLLLRGVDI